MRMTPDGDAMPEAMHRCLYCRNREEHDGKTACHEAYELAVGAGLPVLSVGPERRKLLPIRGDEYAGGMCEAFELLPHEDLLRLDGPELADAAHGLTGEPYANRGLMRGRDCPASL